MWWFSILASPTNNTDCFLDILWQRKIKKWRDHRKGEYPFAFFVFFVSFFTVTEEGINFSITKIDFDSFSFSQFFKEGDGGTNQEAEKT